MQIECPADNCQQVHLYQPDRMTVEEYVDAWTAHWEGPCRSPFAFTHADGSRSGPTPQQRNDFIAQILRGGT